MHLLGQTQIVANTYVARQSNLPTAKTKYEQRASRVAGGPDKEVPSPVFAASNQTWYARHLLKLNTTILSLVVLSSANGYDGSLINGIQALATWQSFSSSPQGSWLGFIVSIQPLGQIIAYLPCAWVVQVYGRKVGIAIGYIWLIIGTILCTAAQNSATWILGRLFVGMATAFWFGSVPLLITEIAYPTHRGICTGLWNTGWFLGGLLAAWVTYGTNVHLNSSSWAWRLTALLQLVLPLVALPGLVSAPESPRWLLSHGRTKDARDTLSAIHAGDQTDEIVSLELAEIQSALKLEREAYAIGYRAMFISQGNCRRLFITISRGVLSQWNGVGIAQYYLVSILQMSGITSSTEQTLINGCLQIWNLFCAVLGATLVDIAGRRRLFAFSNISMLICFSIVTACSAAFTNGNRAAGLTVVPFLFLFYGAYDVAYTPLQFLYTVEIWLYGMRARGLAIGLVSTALVIFFNSFVNPIALQAIGWRYYTVYMVVLVISTVVCWLYYPETKCRTIEEIAEIFDGHDAGFESPSKTDHK